MRINVSTHERIDREVLVNAVLCGQLAILANEPPKRRLDGPAHRERLVLAAELAVRRVIELRATQEARTLAEARYLDAHPALFSDAVRTWAEQVKEGEHLAVTADRLAELDGAARPEFDFGEAVEARVPGLLADLVEPAKATTLEKLGESERAVRIATNWLQARATDRTRRDHDYAWAATTAPHATGLRAEPLAPVRGREGHLGE